VTDWYIYIVRCRDDSLYTGITTDVPHRFAAHQGRGDGGAKYLRGRGPLEVVFQKKLGDHRLALGVEIRVKKLTRAQKVALVTTGQHLGAIVAAVTRRQTGSGQSQK
jgi:putative endonuclease